MYTDPKAVKAIWEEQQRRLIAKELPKKNKGDDINGLEKEARDEVEEIKYKLDHPEDKDVFQQ